MLPPASSLENRRSGPTSPPEQADEQKLNLSVRLDIEAPLNEMGERCSWPWDPQLLVGCPIGQYRCPFCRAMVIAGVPHLDYRDALDETVKDRG